MRAEMRKAKGRTKKGTGLFASIPRGTERGMAIDDGALAHHANPLKCYTRSMYLLLPVVGSWSQERFGWRSLVPIAATLI